MCMMAPGSNFNQQVGQENRPMAGSITAGAEGSFWGGGSAGGMAPAGASGMTKCFPQEGQSTSIPAASGSAFNLRPQPEQRNRISISIKHPQIQSIVSRRIFAPQIYAALSKCPQVSAYQTLGLCWHTFTNICLELILRTSRKPL